MRVCIEIEANFKAILRENNFTPFYQNWERNGQPRDESKWKLSDYKKVNKTHFLSGYSVNFQYGIEKEKFSLLIKNGEFRTNFLGMMHIIIVNMIDIKNSRKRILRIFCEQSHDY